ncbi:unnamed protein product [Ambrosiozyma monospora]|uniref:Unnamed protein product n=1 Tax=Ambrosiozyma monospora TaxID=43982 RepID=A0A9W6YZ61_AMBMO|nr:unnamed protein product [Ambrosiozyma monospora]
MRILLSAVRLEDRILEVQLDDSLQLVKKTVPKFESKVSDQIVEAIACVEYNGSKFLAIGRHTGVVEIFNDDQEPDSGSYEGHNFVPAAVLHDNIRYETDSIISIQQVNEYLIVASNRGLISIYSIEQIFRNDDLSAFSMIVNGEPLEFCINFHDNPFKLIVGE